MTFNVFTQAKKSFEHSIEDPSLGVAFVIVFLTGVLWSAISLTVLNDIFAAGILIFINISQWIILSILLFIFEILFSGQKKHQIRANFSVSLSITGKLWVFALITAILFNIFFFADGSIFAVIAGILILIVSIIAIYGSFIAVKVALDSSNSRALVVWALLLITYFLLIIIAGIITRVILLP